MTEYRGGGPANLRTSIMTTRIIAAALCCLLLTACGSLADYQRDRDLNQQYGQLSEALKHQKAIK